MFADIELSRQRLDPTDNFRKRAFVASPRQCSIPRRNRSNGLYVEKSRLLLVFAPGSRPAMDNLLHSLPRDAVRLFLQNASPSAAFGKLIGAFTERPGGPWCISHGVCSRERPGAFQLFSVQCKSQDAPAQAAFDIVGFQIWFPRSTIPEHDGTRLMHAFEQQVCPAMILHLDGFANYSGATARAFRKGPAQQHAIPL